MNYRNSIAEMAVKKSKRQRESENTRKESAEYFDILPDDVLTRILVLLPAELLQYKVKFVCKQWFKIITQQILFNQSSIIIQKPVEKGQLYSSRGKGLNVYTTRLVELNEGNSNLRVKDQYLNIPCKGRIKSSCNEFLLITDPRKHGALYLFNRITKVGKILPRGSNDCKGHAACKCGLGVAFDMFREVYKVIHVFVGAQSIQCEMFCFKNESYFLNRLKWKRIDGPPYVGNRKYFWDDPVSVNGRYFHWDVHSAEYILSMDIVEERFCQIHLPESMKTYSLLDMGGYLCIQSPFFVNFAEIWILKNFQRQEWHKLQTIRNSGYIYLTALAGSQQPFSVPIASLKVGGYIIYRKTGDQLGLFGYKPENDHMPKLDIPIDADERCLALSTALNF